MALYDTKLSPNHLTLPVEVVGEIVSNLSPAELSTLCRVNHTFQAEANRFLYRSIGHLWPPEKLEACLRTISEAKDKAVLVKRLIVNWHSHPHHVIGAAIIDHVCINLPKMACLEHLELRVPASCFSPQQRYLMTVALWYASPSDTVPHFNTLFSSRCSTFRLTTLYSTYFLLDKDFLLKQTSLKYLLFDYVVWVTPEMLPVYWQIFDVVPSEIRSSLSSVMSVCEADFPETYKVTAFPILSQDWSAAPIKQATATFFIQPSKVIWFALYIHSLFDEHLERYIRSIADNFSDVTLLQLVVEDFQIEASRLAIL
jgi:hypothetical protein